MVGIYRAPRCCLKFLLPSWALGLPDYNNCLSCFHVYLGCVRRHYDSRLRGSLVYYILLGQLQSVVNILGYTPSS